MSVNATQFRAVNHGDCDFNKAGRLGDDLSVKRLPNGNVEIDTGRYIIEVSENEKGGRAKIFDKQTGTWTEAHGDPHLTTGDGDKAGFTMNNLTIDLQDGTKVTIDVTEAKNNVSWIDSVSVMRGDEAVVVQNVRDDAGKEMTVTHTNDVAWADNLHDDGTVLIAGNEVDDLAFANGGKEIIGKDTTQRWDEHQLDGKGGVSSLDYTKGALSQKTDFSGMSIEEILYSLASMIDDQARSAAENISKKIQADQSARSRYEIDKENGTQKELTAENYPGLLDEGEKQRLLNSLDKLQKLVQQLTTMAANISKTHHDSNMAVINNMRP